MREINLKNEFAKWFHPRSPQSYKQWHRKNLNEKLNDIDEVYMASFKKSLFNVDFGNVEKEISKIKSSCLKIKKSVPSGMRRKKIGFLALWTFAEP